MFIYLRRLLLAFSLIVLFIVPVNAHAQSAVQGVVYEDLNKNNVRDQNERGIPGVAVSNGIEVVLTDSKGVYVLPISDDSIIFVIKPSHYTFLLNQYNLPRFFRIHKPKGSPKLKYAGTLPTGKIPESLDFALVPIKPEAHFRMLVFGDPQPYNREEVNLFYGGIVKELLNVKDVAFGISLGDLVGDDLDLFLPYKEAVKRIGIPWYNVMGNHDMNRDAQADQMSDETYERHFGPASYALNHGMVHFIILDDVLYPDPRDGERYWGGFREDQMRFIENDLKFVPKDHLVVLAFHIPMSEHEKWDSFRDEDRAKLFQLLKDYPFTLSLSAHSHFQSQDFFFEKDGWLQEKPHHHYNVGTTCGDWYSGRLDPEGIPVSTMRDGTPKGYAYLSFKKNQYMIDYKVAGKPSDYQIKIHAPKVVEQAKWTSAGIFANFFIGSKFDTLFFKIDDGTWKEMDYFKTYDPAYYQQVLEWDSAEELLDGRRPSNPTECDHLWYTRLPCDLKLGQHTIAVKAVDMFGRTFIQTRSYRILRRP